MQKIIPNFNFIFIRAFGSLKNITLESKRYSKKGIICAYKGTNEKVVSEISELKKSDSVIKKINVPFLNEERHIVLIKI